MNSFLKSVRSGSNNADSLVRKSIITQLSESVKELQLCGLEESNSGDSFDTADASNNFCSIIEAMFLHGLKDSLIHKARRVIGNDFDQRPEPSFLSPLYIYSHRQTIEQISSLPQITTDIGQCRAWIRIALNDSLLSSYISLMARDPKPLAQFYKPFAFMRDIDTLDVARKLIESVEMCNNFTLPCNSSLLNHWPLPTLLLVGIWSPPLRQCPISSGIDVAQSLEEPSYLKSMSDSSSRSNLSLTSEASEFSKMLALNEDDALKIILANTKQSIPPTNHVLQIKQEARHLNTKQDGAIDTDSNQPCSSSDTSSMEKPASEELTNMGGNSLNRHSGWSFDENHSEIKSPELPQQNKDGPNFDGLKSNEHSYHALIESYNLVSGPESAPNLDDVLNKLNLGTTVATSSSNDDDCWSPNSLPDVSTFEFTHVRNIDKARLATLLAQVGKLPLEKGLDNQNYECFGCKHPLGINLCKPRICAFTGDCFCDSCMSSEPTIIPARVIHNWDFKQYYVSKEAATFLSEIKNHPVLDLKILNPLIYKGVEEMQRLKNVRVQLNYLRDYLFTCREPVIEQFKKFIWPRDYMYEHIHQYSIEDLTKINGGQLVTELQKLVNFGRDHVANCWLCSQKGFVCEICKNSKILYPFNVNSTFRCNSCSAVYHTNCLDFTKPCPKCKRKRERLEKQELSLFEATLK